jgi:hypothetical protein
MPHPTLVKLAIKAMSTTWLLLSVATQLPAPAFARNGDCENVLQIQAVGAGLTIHDSAAHQPRGPCSVHQ